MKFMTIDLHRTYCFCTRYLLVAPLPLSRTMLACIGRLADYYSILTMVRSYGYDATVELKRRALSAPESALHPSIFLLPISTPLETIFILAKLGSDVPAA
jgi:hypothetical protein